MIDTITIEPLEEKDEDFAEKLERCINQEPEKGTLDIILIDKISL